jgi:predicted MPP superfamily phosphohydrolase
VLGNHDWWYDGKRVRRALESARITVLENEAARIDRGADSVYVVGLADPWTREVDLARAFGTVPDGALRLVLVHEPDIFPNVPDSATLTFAAHTHGGQVRLPFWGPLVVPSDYGRRYAAGHVWEGGRDLFVTTGVGTSILPVRFGVPPEVAIVTVGPAR